MTVTIANHTMGTTNGATNGTPYTLTIPALTTGNLGCGFIYGGSTTTGWAVTDANNTYTVDTTTIGQDTTDGVFIYSFYNTNLTGGATSLVVHRTGGDNVSACYIELHSTTGWTGFRNAAGGQNNTAAATVVCSSSLGASGDVIVAACWQNFGQTATVSDGVLTRLDFNADDTPGIIGADSYVLSATSAVTPGFNFTPTSATGAISALAFTPAAASSNPFYYRDLEVRNRNPSLLRLDPNNRNFSDSYSLTLIGQDALIGQGVM